jgi:hypothetical protein
VQRLLLPCHKAKATLRHRLARLRLRGLSVKQKNAQAVEGLGKVHQGKPT